MLRFLSSISDSVMFWRIMFFVMALCALCFYANPRIVIKEEHIFLIMDHDDDGEPFITESRAI